MGSPVEPSTTKSEPNTFGIAAMDGFLSEANVEFPATRNDIIDALGNRSVPYDPRGNTIELASALRDTGQETFESRRELLEALHPVFEEQRTGGGLEQWLRNLFSS